MTTISVFFANETKEILYEADRLQKALTHLRYEGKVSRGRNVKAVLKSTGMLKELFQKHAGLQEKIIFPFLLARLPRYEAAILFLRTDHQDLSRQAGKLAASVRRLGGRSYNRIADGNVQETGIYLISVLRHHLALEKKCIHKALWKELNEEEKEEFRKKINRWLERRPAGTAAG